MSGDEQALRRSDGCPAVFVSHSSKDREVVKHIVSALRRADIETYYSTEDQRPSTREFAEEIQEKLLGCHVVLGVQSSNALKSDWVKAEWGRARKKRKLMFARIERFDADALPMIYDGFHFARLWDWDGSQEHVECQNLIERVKAEVRERETLSVTPLTPAAVEDKQARETRPDRADGAAAPSAAASSAASIPVREQSLGSMNALVAAPPPQQANNVVIVVDESALPPLTTPLALGLEPKDWSLLNPLPLVEKAVKTATLEQILHAARSGQTDAQAIAGIAHQLGACGAAQDDGAAGRWLEKAALGGSPRAKAELAVLIALRRFGVFDVDRIDQLAAEAATTECARAKTLRALLRLTGTRLQSVTFETATRLLEDATNAGDLLAAAHYGWSLLEGRGVRQNRARAYEVLRTAAQAGEPRAMAHLGVMYAFGRGVRRDNSKAAHWFGEAARRGDQWGEFYYGWSHEGGVGVARDAGQARKWYAKAAAREDHEAQIRLARMMIDGRGGVNDYATAARLLTSAAESGEEEAMALLAQLYEDGRGVGKDLHKAIELYKQAAEGDEPNALWRLGTFYEGGRGLERDRDKAISLFRRAAFNAPDKRFLSIVLQRLSHHGAQLRRPKAG